MTKERYGDVPIRVLFTVLADKNLSRRHYTRDAIRVPPGVFEVCSYSLRRRIVSSHQESKGPVPSGTTVEAFHQRRLEELMELSQRPLQDETRMAKRKSSYAFVGNVTCSKTAFILWRLSVLRTGFRIKTSRRRSTKRSRILSGNSAKRQLKSFKGRIRKRLRAAHRRVNPKQRMNQRPLQLRHQSILLQSPPPSTPWPSLSYWIHCTVLCVTTDS